MKSLNRRDFLKAGVAAGATLSMPFPAITQTKSPGETINVACVGINGRGQSHISGYNALKEKSVRLAALCDVDQKVLGSNVAKYSGKTGKVDGYSDIRKLLENKDIDAISIATPNHWHSLAAIWSMQAGKDVYVEKPVSHNVWEGRQCVNAARKYNKICQTGTQSRSSRAGIFEAVKWAQAGNLGKILIARGMCYKPRGSIGKSDAAQSVPDTIDYDLWCGPAPKDELRRKRLHYDWHWIWNYGNGDLGNQGIHQMDIARWFLGEMELPPRVWSVGGRLGYVDDGETANTQIVFQDYKKAPLIFEVRGLPSKKGAKNMDNFMGAGVGVVIHCEGGYITVPNYNGGSAHDKDGKEIKKWSGSSDHFANFIEACRSRKHTDLHADILEGHLSSALCHTGNISYRLGTKYNSGEILEKIKGDRGASETFERMTNHLAANEVDINMDKLALGPVLTMDPKTERFLGNPEADKMLTREYRKPFVVPEITLG